jgi:hypothetical protein
MEKKELKRKYLFSDAKLVLLGNTKIAFMRRDAAAFAAFGLTETQFGALEAEIEAFSDVRTDIESKAKQVQATSDKDVKAEELRTAIRAVMTRVALKYGDKSARYRNFGAETLSRQTDADLTLTAKRVVRVGKEDLADYAAQGLTIGLLDEITALNAEFSDLIISKELKVGARDIEQEDRVEAGNAIYATLVSYTKTGQDIWVSTDVAKYNDYVIYNTKSGEEELVAPQDPV